MTSNHSDSSSAHPFSPSGAFVPSDPSPPHSVVSPTESTRSIQSAPSAPETALTDDSADSSPRASFDSNRTFGGHWSLQPSHPLLHERPDSDNDSFMSAKSFAARKAARTPTPPSVPRVSSMSAFHGGDSGESGASTQCASPKSGRTSPPSSRTPTTDISDLMQTRSNEHCTLRASETFRSIPELYAMDPAMTLDALGCSLQDLDVKVIPGAKVREWEETSKRHAEQIRRLHDKLASTSRERDHALMRSGELEQVTSHAKKKIESLEEELRQADIALLTSREKLDIQQRQFTAQGPSPVQGPNYVDPRERNVPSEDLPPRLYRPASTKEGRLGRARPKSSHPGQPW